MSNKRSIGQVSDNLSVKVLSNTYCIYALVDPRDDSIRYIGMSNTLETRLAKHRHDTDGTAEKQQWIRKLREIGISFVPWVLEEGLEKQCAYARERWWIAYCLEGGEPLLNSESPRVRETRGRKRKGSGAISSQPRKMRWYLKQKGQL